MRPLLLLATVASCARAPEAVAPDTAKGGAQPPAVSREAVEPQAARAEQAFGALKARLMTRLSVAMGEGGPAAAIAVCSSEAQKMTAEIGAANGLELGRTSFRVRNRANAPRPWAATTVAAGEGQQAAEVKPALFDLGDRVGVLAPMPVGAMCVTCHGPKEQLPPEVSAALAERYPSDRATGFAEGDLRGFFWAEVPKG